MGQIGAFFDVIIDGVQNQPVVFRESGSWRRGTLFLCRRRAPLFFIGGDKLKGTAFGEEDDPQIKELLAKAQPLQPDLPTKPRVFYLNLPRKWIAGAVYDSEADECTEGASVTATNTSTGKQTSTQTDNYGDFWLKDLDDGTYTILIEKKGYLTQKLGPIDATQKDQNLGDIVLWKG